MKNYTTMSVLEQNSSGPVITEHLCTLDGQHHIITIENIDPSKEYTLTFPGGTYTINKTLKTKRIKAKKHSDSNIRKVIRSKKERY